MCFSIAETAEGAAVIVQSADLTNEREVQRFTNYSDAVREYDWITVSRRRGSTLRLELIECRCGAPKDCALYEHSIDCEYLTAEPDRA